MPNQEVAVALEKEPEYKPGNTIAFGIGSMGDTIAYEYFTIMVFTFYYSVIGISIPLVTIGFIIWTFWNAFNDPIAGIISDRTKTRWGRRIPYIIFTFIPLSLLLVLLWTTPYPNLELSFIYFVIIIIVFDAVYTVNALNLTSLFPEMYLTDEARLKANRVRQLLLIVGLVLSMVLPMFLITDPTAKDSPDIAYHIQIIGQYQLTGIILGFIVAISYIICLKWGVRERPEFSQDSLQVPTSLKAIRHTLGNKAFQIFLITNTANWYVFGILPTIIPIYGQFVLEIPAGQSILIGILLALAFVSGLLWINIWRWLEKRWNDLRKSWIISMASWILGLMPLFFIQGAALLPIAMGIFFLAGIGLSGSLYFKDLVVSDIVDEDEIKTGVRREGSYYGVNALIMRFNTLFIFLTFNFVLISVGWEVFLPSVVTPEVLLGLRMLVSLFPSIALTIGILAFSFYPIHGARLKKLREQQKQLHVEKRERIIRK